MAGKRRMRVLDTETRLCAVIGHPVGHSLSPAMHNAAFRAVGLNYVYLAFDVERLADFAAGMRAMAGFRGASVTIPHKVEIIPHLDEVDAQASRVGSVNTILRLDDGRLFGATTDGRGTLRAFSEAGVSLSGRRVLFLGTGGAVRAVAFAMAEEAVPERITILGRTRAHVERLVSDLRHSARVLVEGGPLDDGVGAAVERHDVICQGTPVGMYPHGTGETLVPRAALRAGQVVFDMVYRPQRTRLIEDALDAGCQCILGLEMLLYQAALQFEMWTGHAAPVPVMRAALLDALSEPSAGKEG